MVKRRVGHESGSRWVSPDDIELYLNICDFIEKYGKVATLQAIARDMGRPLSTVSQCLSRLEERYHCELIERTPRVGITGLTTQGRRSREFFKKALAALEAIDGSRSKTHEEVRLLTTNALRNYFVPAPVSAHLLKLREAGVDDTVQILMEEMDYPDLVSSVRRGVVPFAIGWELEEGWYHDLKVEPLPGAFVPFGVILGRPEIRGAGENDGLNELFGLKKESQRSDEAARLQFTRVKEELSATGCESDIGDVKASLDRIWETFTRSEDGEPIQIDELRDRLAGKSLVVLKNEFDRTLRRLQDAPGINRIIQVDSYEDTLTAVRTGLADVGWAPIYYKNRRHIHFRSLVFVDSEGERLQVGRNVVFYMHKEKDFEATPSGALYHTIKAFLQSESKDEKGRLISFGKRISAGGKIDPKEILSWVKKTGRIV